MSPIIEAVEEIQSGGETHSAERKPIMQLIDAFLRGRKSGSR